MHSDFPMEGILLVSDIDGTLITSDFKLPQRNMEAIERFQKEGGLFSVATGRNEISAERYISKVTLNAPSILYNGSVLYDFAAHKMLWSTALPEKSHEIARMVLKKFPDMGIEVYYEGCVYLINVNPHTKAHIIDEKFNYEITTVDDAPSDWLKLLFACDNKRLLDVKQFLDSLDMSGMYYVFSSDHFLEVLPEGVSKGTTLRRISKMCNIKPENIIAIGDYYNDMELISMAGMGVTVENAPDEVKKIASVIMGRCENGAVADIIEYLEKMRKC